jgi:hypothetical protein
MADRFTPEQRQLRGRIGGYRLHARRGSFVEHAQAGFRARFAREAAEAARERCETLSAEELEIRAQRLFKAYMASLALRSSIARTSRSERCAPGRGGRNATA